MTPEAREKALIRIESVLRDAEGYANQCLAAPVKERGLDREVMALAIHEALVTLRTLRG